MVYLRPKFLSLVVLALSGAAVRRVLIESRTAHVAALAKTSHIEIFRNKTFYFWDRNKYKTA